MNWPWLRKIAWYRKIWRVFHCMFSMMGPAVFLGYLIDDIEWWIQKVDS